MNYIYILLRISLKNIENWNVISGFFWIKTSFLLGSKLYFQNIYERVAVGRKNPCTRPLWICLLGELLQSLFHVQMGLNLKTQQSLYVQPLCLWPDENLLTWSGAIHLQKKAIILAVNTAIYMVKVVVAGWV